MYLLTGLLGLALIAAPYIFEYSGNMAALWSSLVIGAVLIVSSVLEGLAADRQKWEYWVAAFAGIAAILAPFVLGFSALTQAVWTLVIVGLAVLLTASSKLFPWRVPHYR
jgi:uncharacterized membrane protein HdeD (DUF308 family)